MMAKQSVIKRKKNPGFIIPLVLALAVTFLFYEGAQKKTLADVHPVQVPVAKEVLTEHSKIKDTDIAMISIPIKGVPPNILTNPKDIVGKYVGTQYTISKNGYFYKDSISTLEEIPSNISMMLGPNELGVTLQMNLEKSVANSLEAGQYVQVRFFTNKTQKQQPFEGVLFDRLKILSLRNNSGINVSNTDNAKTTQVPTVVVFQANDEQVSYLIRAQSIGSLNIVAIPSQAADASSTTFGNKDGKTADSGTAGTQAGTYTGTSKTASGGGQLSDQTIKDVLVAAGKQLTPDQLASLQSALLKNKADSGEGHLYQKNAAELLIDSMSYTVQQLFEKSGILATSTGEIVYYDAKTGQVRYFKDKSEYEGSVYALSQLTPDQIAKLKQDGKLTDAQIQALSSQQQNTQEPRYYQTTKGEIFQIINGQAIFYTNSEVIKALTAFKQTNGSLTPDNQALLNKLLGSANGTTSGTGTGSTGTSTNTDNATGGTTGTSTGSGNTGSGGQAANGR